jgi:hypothetical protein
MNRKEDNNTHNTHIEMKRAGVNGNFIAQPMKKLFTSLKKIFLGF